MVKLLGSTYLIGITSSGKTLSAADILFDLGKQSDGVYMQDPLVLGSYQKVSAFCDWIDMATKAEARCTKVLPYRPGHS